MPPGRARGRRKKDCPTDFLELFAEYGWDADTHCGFHRRLIKRWREELGPELCRAARRDFLQAKREVKARERRKNYRFR